MKIIENKQVEQCPNCGNKNIDYKDHDFNDNMVYFYCNCPKCGCEYAECYTMEFSHHTILEVKE